MYSKLSQKKSNAQYPLLISNFFLITKANTNTLDIKSVLTITANTIPSKEAFKIQKVVQRFQIKKVRNEKKKISLFLSIELNKHNKGTKAIKANNEKPLGGQEKNSNKADKKLNKIL
jgi:hypothetical protein